MKTNIVSIVLSVLLFAGFAAAQKEAITVGPNVVRWTGRHCQGYTVDDKLDSQALAKCIADPSTVFFREQNHNLKTTGGVDWLAKAMSAMTQPAAMNYVELSTDSSTPAVGDCAAGSTSCTLAGAITVASCAGTGCGLTRQKATFTHIDGTSTFKLSYTWTATCASNPCVANLQKAGLFNAATSGTMGFENTFGPYTLNNNDVLTLDGWTISIL